MLTSSILSAKPTPDTTNQSAQKQGYIFVYGGEIKKEYIKFVAALTKKEKPKIGFFPTGTADNPQVINHFYYLCSALQVEPRIVYTWVSSNYCKQSFDDMILDLDAIIVGGGNTLNMIAIWKAQGIDTILKKASDKGIVLAGGSAGSICWFNSGISDSRPQSLSVVNGLGFLNYSHCPHYSNEAPRKQLFQESIIGKVIEAGYACDEGSALLFRNGKFEKSYSLSADSHSYFVEIMDSKIKETILTQELLK